MARGLDEHQQRELTAFVNRLFERAGYRTTADWSRDSGYPAPNLSMLRNGKAGIDGYNLLKLIEAAAERAMVSEEEMAIAAAPRPESLAAAVKEVRALLGELERVSQQFPDPPPLSEEEPERQPGRTARRKGQGRGSAASASPFVSSRREPEQLEPIKPATRVSAQVPGGGTS